MAGSLQTTTASVETNLAGVISSFSLDFTASLSPGMFDLSDKALEDLAMDIGGLPSLDLDSQQLNLGAQAPSSFSLTIDPSALFNTSSSTVTTISSSSSYASPDTSSASATSPPADSYFLPVNELTLLRAFLRIATRLGCAKSLWDLSATSPFCPPLPTAGPTPPFSNLDGAAATGASNNDPGGGGDLAPLPPTWQPTASQQLVPHHPMLDILPWPSARDRVIAVFGLPEAARPPAAAGPLALAELAYDVEDGAEGMRIWGPDPYDPAAWEVGQLLFERWWFIFDRAIVEQSNRWRALRGAGALKMKGEGEWGRMGGFTMGW